MTDVTFQPPSTVGHPVKPDVPPDSVSGTYSSPESAETMEPADLDGQVRRSVLEDFNNRAPAGRLPRLASYSRYVVFMKFLLPAAALGLIVAIIIWPQIQVEDNRFSIRISDVKLSARDNPSMVNARFVGSDKKNQPFSITADLARNLLLGNSNIELEMPKADITVRDGTWLVLTANTGLYDQGGKTLNLEGKVNLFHDSGYEFNTEAADIDLGGGVAKGTVAVRGQGPFGQLEAEGFRIENKGSSIYFTGKSKLTLHAGALKEEK